jgi:hypothetical protein
MRVPRVRFTVRWLMGAVAIVAAIMGGVDLWQRSVFYRSKVAHHARMERSSLFLFWVGNKPNDLKELPRVNRAWTEHHAALRRKYERAAARPWEYVPPDPPDPLQSSGLKGGVVEQGACKG